MTVGGDWHLNGWDLDGEGSPVRRSLLSLNVRTIKIFQVAQIHDSERTGGRNFRGELAVAMKIAEVFQVS